MLSEPIFNHKVTENFDYSLHMSYNFCNLPRYHYHVISSNDKLPDSFKSIASKPLSTPFLLICFKLFIETNLTKTIFCGEIVNKIDEAVIYSEQRQLNFAKLPNVDVVFIRKVQVQTDFLPTCTIDRF